MYTDFFCYERYIASFQKLPWRYRFVTTGCLQAEKELSEVTFQFDSLSERLEEADGLSSAQVRNRRYLGIL